MKATVSTISPEGQVTIPTEIREHFGLHAADDVAFVIDEDGKVELRSALKALEVVFGSVPALPGRETIDFEDQIRDAMEEEAERIVASMGGR